MKKNISLNRRIYFLLAFFALLVSPVLCVEFSTAGRDRVLEEYFPPSLISKMKQDAEPIIKKFGGVNVFSAAQYGDCFITGQTDAGDIFDARIPENLRIFKKYARENLLIRNVPESEHYNKYAPAAVKFTEEFGFDMILFYPDEYHPVLTKPDDAWLFVREEKSEKSGEEYLSCRLRNPAISIEGGLPMEPLKIFDFVQYYIPVAGSSYTPYKTADIKLPAYKLHGDGKFTAAPGNLEKRKAWGIKASPLSGRKNLTVGTWQSKDDAVIRFKATGQRYTWGDNGFYAVPVDPVFWVSPTCAAPVK
ncbi:MAG: hypothetical protein LWY06_09445 [Firmicutes bacterium]|nr:hypothetical protein [Bacillota bacterium]